jgi:hypothetical protein
MAWKAERWFRLALVAALVLATPPFVAAEWPFAAPLFISDMGSNHVDATLEGVCDGLEPFNILGCRFTQVLVERHGNRCHLLPNSFSVDLTRVGDQWKWQHTSEPAGICRVVTFYSLEGNPKDRMNWTYRQRVISSEAGSDCGIITRDERVFSTKIARDLECGTVRIGR